MKEKKPRFKQTKLVTNFTNRIINETNLTKAQITEAILFQLYKETLVKSNVWLFDLVQRNNKELEHERSQGR